MNNPVIQDDDYLDRQQYKALFKQNDFDVVPNPSTGIIKIQTQKRSDDDVLSVNVYDMKGQLILSLDNIASEQEINLEAYTSGIYMVQVISNLGTSTTKKINITH